MRRVAFSLVIVASLASANGARAQGAAPSDCKEDPATCGRRAFDAGVEAYKRNAWREALGHFRAAYDIRRHPIVIYNLALTEEKLTLFVEALAHAKELGLAPDRTPELSAKAKELEQRLLRQVVTLSVDLPGAREVHLFVDDHEMPDFENARVNPGSHRVRVLADGSERIQREIETQAGERVVLTLDAAKKLGTRSGADSSPERDQPSRGIEPTWFYVAAGATAVVGGIAIWSGIDTLNAKSDYEDGKPYATKADEESALDDGHSRERRTNVLLGVTGVLAVGTTALGLFAVDWGNEKTVSVVPTLGGAMVIGRY